MNNQTDKANQLKNLWPEYFGNVDEGTDLWARVLIILSTLEDRYFSKCNPKITRRQAEEIRVLIADIKTKLKTNP